MTGIGQVDLCRVTTADGLLLDGALRVPSGPRTSLPIGPTSGLLVIWPIIPGSRNSTCTVPAASWRITTLHGRSFK